MVLVVIITFFLFAIKPMVDTATAGFGGGLANAVIIIILDTVYGKIAKTMVRLLLLHRPCPPLLALAPVSAVCLSQLFACLNCLPVSTVPPSQLTPILWPASSKVEFENHEFQVLLVLTSLLLSVCLSQLTTTSRAPTTTA